MGTPTLASLQGPGSSQDTSISPDAVDAQRRQDTSVVLSPDAVDAQRRQDPTTTLEYQRATGAYQAERDRHPEPIEYSALSSGVFNPRGTIASFSMVSPGVYTRQDRSATPTVPVPREDPKPTEIPEYPHHWGQGISSPPSGPLPATAAVDEYRRRDPETGLSLDDIITLSEMRETADVQHQIDKDRLLEGGPGAGTGPLNPDYPGLLDSTGPAQGGSAKAGVHGQADTGIRSIGECRGAGKCPGNGSPWVRILSSRQEGGLEGRDHLRGSRRPLVCARHRFRWPGARCGIRGSRGRHPDYWAHLHPSH